MNVPVTYRSSEIGSYNQNAPRSYIERLSGQVTHIRREQKADCALFLITCYDRLEVIHPGSAWYGLSKRDEQSTSSRYKTYIGQEPMCQALALGTVVLAGVVPS